MTGLMHPKRAVARVVLELDSPMSIGTGAEGLYADNALVLDANDLPSIPGTSLAGVLRAVWAAKLGAKEADRAFGFQEPKQRGTEEAAGQRSAVRVSWGMIHDQHDRPVEGLHLPSVLAGDPVLASAAGVRDHVRLNHRGVADGHGKFDRASVLAGHRFTFELESVGEGSEAWLRTLLGYLADPTLRLGAATRAGLGMFHVVQAGIRSYDLRVDHQEWCARPMRLADVVPGMVAVGVTVGERSGTHARLVLTSDEPWQVGGGDGDGIEADEHKDAQILPYTEARIRWSKGRGKVAGPDLVLPASALKGAIRHRTAYHLRALKKRFAGQIDAAAQRHDLDPFGPETEPEVVALFGTIKANDEGQAGRVWLGDARVPLKDVTLATCTHLSVDRFTGGPLAGHLFQETSVGRTTLEVPIVLQANPEEAEGLSLALRALSMALRDLREGLLQVGAGAGRGYGYFAGQAPVWTGPLKAQLEGV